MPKIKPTAELSLHYVIAYFAYLLIGWGFYRFLFQLPEEIEEGIVKPLVWLIPLFVIAEASQVFVSIDGKPRGHFAIRTTVRENISAMISRLGRKCHALLSGDRDSGWQEMRRLFSGHVELMFNQSPEEKLHYIKDLQQKGKKVLMAGDGLNDAGALKQSDVGIAISDDSGVFTPASDGILYGNNLQFLDKFLALARSSTNIVKAGFAISFVYNAIALSFAVSGHLTPLAAAILMPISSISVVSFTTLAVNFTARKKLGTTKCNDYEIYHR